MKINIEKITNGWDSGKTLLTAEIMTNDIKIFLADSFKKLINKEVDIVKVDYLCPSLAISILESLGADVSDDMDTNGWQYDYWIKFTYNGNKYCISGGGYYGTLELEGDYED
jgi:hypothetical protein